MTTDPGDLVLDPTCGSGTTAYAAEQWGRRWITIDTSRVALALARARIMGARYPYYLLKDSASGQHKEAEITRTAPSSAPTFGNIRQGFVYERAPHIMLKSIANNAEIDVIWDKHQATLEPLRTKLNAALGKQWQGWEIPREAGAGWPAQAKELHAAWWEGRIARQREIDASIAAKAEFEYLYDQPYEDKSVVRVAGPFTVESVSPHRVLAVDENDELIPAEKFIHEGGAGYGEGYNFTQVILDNLKAAGVQQAHKQDRISWSLRVNSDIRIIVHKTASSLLLCYVDHHDAAYAWAERRKLERHPTTGAAQIVEVRERVQEIITYAPKQAAAPPKPRLFARIADAQLLSYGVPTEWLADVRQVDEDSLFRVVEHLPQEAGEALLELAVGGTPRVPAPTPAESDPFQHPDAQRRFRVLQNVEELERALEYPWDRWTIFLHPAQRQLVEREQSGPARISGSAGTGKTIVALHRAVFLARKHPDARVVLLTFSDALANALSHKLKRLTDKEPQLQDRIGVYATKEFAQELYVEAFGEPTIATPGQLRELLKQAAGAEPGQRFSPQFLFDEWSDVVDVWGLDSWERYRDVPRLGRKTRIGGRQREMLWAIFARVQAQLVERGLLTWPMLLRRTGEHLVASGERPFDFAIIDESQDLDVAELRFLATLGDRRSDSLFFTGDLGQRIFQQAFPWKAVGVDVRGRSHALTINYRTSHQIRRQADKLLPRSLADVDGNVEERGGTISIFNGPAPTIDIFAGEEEEGQAVGKWIAERLGEGLRPEEIGVFVRSAAQLPRALVAISKASATPVELDHYVAAREGCIAVSTMHLAKGLEFRAVAVMACDDEVIPLQERIEGVTDESDLEEVYNTERHLLYVACTRARDHLLVTGVDPASEFLDDMG